MRQTRKIRGGAPPAFKNAKPANLTKLSKVNARNFIRGVCTKELPNYLALIKKERGCVNNVCPAKMTENQKQWADVEKDFTTQCATAERLKLIKNIPASANLDPSYIKSTADRLIEDMKESAAAAAKPSYAAAVKGNMTAKTTTKAATATATATAPAPTTNLFTSMQQSIIGTSSPAKSTGSTIEQNIKKITQNLQAAKQVLASMAKTGGAKKRRTRRTQRN